MNSQLQKKKKSGVENEANKIFIVEANLHYAIRQHLHKKLDFFAETRRNQKKKKKRCPHNSFALPVNNFSFPELYNFIWKPSTPTVKRVKANNKREAKSPFPATAYYSTNTDTRINQKQS